MNSLAASMKEYKKQMEKGDIRRAYIGILGLMKDIKKQLETVYPDYTFSSGIFEGRMDFTYFHFTTPFLKEHKLKYVILFVHETFTFEVLLSGINRKVQEKYWKLLKDQKFDKYRLAADPKTEDYIIGEIITDNPDFDDLEELTDIIYKKVSEFKENIDDYFKYIS